VCSSDLVVAIGSAGAVFQLHVLGIVFLPPILALLVAEIRGAGRRRDKALAGRLVGAGLAGLAVVAVLFVPLAIHEVQSDFSETHRVIEYFAASGQTPDQLDPPARLVFTLFRIVAWPLVGVVTGAPLGAALALALTLALGTWAALTFEGEQRVAVRWLLGTIAWSAVALTVLAPSLQTVVAGLPNDHYHAYLDPVVIVLLSVAGVGLATARRDLAPAGRDLARVNRDPEAPLSRGPAVGVVARAIVAAGVVVLVVIGVTRWPPPTDPNGGWPAAQAAGQRIAQTTGTEQVWVVGVPSFKAPDDIVYAIVAAGGSASGASRLVDPYEVVACDRLFESVVGLACGGPAEDQRVGIAGGNASAALVSRFDASPRTSVSLYAFGTR